MPMKTVCEVMTADVVHISPVNKVKTAIILMKGHNIGGLPVVDGGRLVGVLDYQDILGKDSDIEVQNVMDTEFVTIAPDVSVLDAAELMSEINSSRLLVMEDERLVGIITHGDLIPELGKSSDPITGLPRVDAMRDWGIAALKSGTEITVIFIDLDGFGMFNKKYGHIIGDKVLQHMADILREQVDPETDMLCRYAGDEFVIVTVRESADARALADRIADSIHPTTNGDIPEPVCGSVGVYGGQRTKEREDVHFNATLDNLINFASKSCTKAKEIMLPDESDGESPESVVPGGAERAVVCATDGGGMSPDGSARLKLQSLNVSWSDASMATAEVELRNGLLSYKKSQNGLALGNNALRLVAEATAQAVSAFLPDNRYSIIADNVNVVTSGAGEDIVLVTAMVVTPKSQIRVSGSSIIRHDAYRAASSALLDAVNRQVSLLVKSA